MNVTKNIGYRNCAMLYEISVFRANFIIRVLGIRKIISFGIYQFSELWL